MVALPLILLTVSVCFSVTGLFTSPRSHLFRPLPL